MNRQTKFITFILFLAIFILSASSGADIRPTYALVNCKIFPVSSPPIEKGTIIIRDGLIESLGPVDKITIPEDAEVIKAEGLCAYPGLIDAHASIMLKTAEKKKPAAGAQTASSAAQEPVKHHPELEAFQLLEPKKSTVDNLHKVGITSVLIVPDKGIFAGQSVLVNLNGLKSETMVVKNKFSLHLNFTTLRGTYPSSLMGTMAFLRQSFLDAHRYSLWKFRYEKASRGLKRPEFNPFLEALLPFIVNKKPLVFNCANQEDIKRAISLINEFKLNGYISGANEAWRVAGLLKKTRIPLLISLNFKPPLTSTYATQGKEVKEKAEKEIYPANAAKLYQQGIKFALTSNGLKTPAEVLKNIQKAIKAGLPQEEALKALTLIPARFLGADNILGSLEPGKIANIILTTAEIFKEKAKVKKIFVDGLSFEIKEPPKGAKPPSLNIAGKWRADVSGPMGEMEMTLEIEQEKNQISGTLNSEFGQWEINDGLLSGQELTFSISATIMGETMELSFEGKATKDSIEGTISFSGGSAELRATRIPDGLL